jgi:hypothetical protein
MAKIQWCLLSSGSRVRVLPGTLAFSVLFFQTKVL